MSMNSKKITDMVKNKSVKFVYFRDNNFMYETEDGFTFPVPLDDVGTSTLLATDKALYFMRWIRKHLQTVEDEKNASQPTAHNYNPAAEFIPGIDDV